MHRTNYKLGEHSLQRVFEFKDLGINLDTKLSFPRHIEIITAKAYSMLGFVKRICSNMMNPYALKSIYCAFVRSKLEYASVVWNPFYGSGSNAIESIQKKFVIFALRKSGWRSDTFVLPPYSVRSQLIGLELLERRRSNASVFFIYDIFHGFIDAPALVYMLEHNDSSHTTRNNRMFRIEHHATNYACNHPMTRMCTIFNEISIHHVSSTSRDNFRSRIKALATINAFGNSS